MRYCCHVKALVICILATGCVEAGTEPLTGTVHADEAIWTANQVAAVTSAMSASSTPDAMTAINELTQHRWAILDVPGMSTRGLHDDHNFGAVPPGTGQCTDAGCTYSRGGSGGSMNHFMVEGTVSRTGDAFGFDLGFDDLQYKNSYVWTIDGEVVATATGLDGTIHTAGTDVTVPDVKKAWDITVAFEQIVLDAQRCPIGGSLHARTTGKRGEQAPVTREGSVAFGPMCNETH